MQRREWQVVDYIGLPGAERLSVETKNGHGIADVVNPVEHMTDITLEDARNNAMLLAAAPAMLEALDSIFRFGLCPKPKTLKGWEQLHASIDRIARNAINKAEGSNL